MGGGKEEKEDGRQRWQDNPKQHGNPVKSKKVLWTNERAKVLHAEREQEGKKKKRGNAHFFLTCFREDERSSQKPGKRKEILAAQLESVHGGRRGNKMSGKDKKKKKAARGEATFFRKAKLIFMGKYRGGRRCERARGKSPNSLGKKDLVGDETHLSGGKSIRHVGDEWRGKGVIILQRKDQGRASCR